MATLRNVKIWYKWPDPCSCGCQGQDPWHKASYRRTITLDEGSATSGTVSLPFSTKPVKVTFQHGSVWLVDRSSIVFDKR